MVAVGKCARTAASPAALLFPYSAALSGSAPMAEIWTSAAYTLFGGSLGDVACADILDRIHIGETAHQIDDSVGIGDGAFDAAGFPDIGGDKLDLTQIAQRLDIDGVRRVAACDAYADAHGEQLLRDISAQESRCLRKW